MQKSNEENRRATVHRKLNADQKRARLAGELRLFVRQYARKAREGAEPNDRSYERDLERQVKRMRPDDDV